MILGLTSEETLLASQLVTKANNEQVKALLSMLQGELKKRELLAGNFKTTPPKVKE